MADSFEDELRAFEREQDAAQRNFFAYMSIRSLALEDADVLSNMQSNALFWTTAHEAMMNATFIAIGRIFDLNPKSDHTIAKLTASLSANIDQFSRGALASRKVMAGVSQDAADEFASVAYELTHKDIRSMKKHIVEWREIYHLRYRDVRDQVYAHNRKPETMRALLAKTNFDEMQAMLAFFAGLHSGLQQLWINGLRPTFAPYNFKLPAPTGLVMTGGEMVYLQGRGVLQMVTRPDPDEPATMPVKLTDPPHPSSAVPASSLRGS